MSNKYGARKVQLCGLTFDSKKEADRYLLLLARQEDGEIADLQVKPAFELAPAVRLNGRQKPALRYTADFAYMDLTNFSEYVVEDVKGGRATQTEAYRIRKHLMKVVHGIEVREV